MRSTTVLALATATFVASVAACSTSESTDAPAGPTQIVGETTSFEACPAAGPSGVTLLRCEATTATARIALGLCGDLVADNTLTLSTTGADLEVSGTSTTSAPLVVAGDFGSGEEIDAKNTQQIGGSLRTGGNWSTSAPVTVAGDALLTGSLQANNTVAVTGTLQAASIEAPQSSAVQAGTVVQSSAPFQARLDCDRRANVVAAAQAVALDPGRPVALAEDTLADVDRSTDLTLGCGSYVFSAIDVNAPLTIHVSSSVVFLVRGSLTIGSPMIVDVAPGATLDFAVEGDVAVNNTLTFSGASDAGAVDFLVGGKLDVASPLQVDGSLVVQGATEANNTVDVSGAAFLSDLHVASPVVIHTGGAPGFDGTGCFVTSTATPSDD